MVFCKLFLGITQTVVEDSKGIRTLALHPFQFATTASVCMAVFKCLFLEGTYSEVKEPFSLQYIFQL